MAPPHRALAATTEAKTKTANPNTLTHQAGPLWQQRCDVGLENLKEWPR